jgi:hypothetical protein
MTDEDAFDHVATMSDHVTDDEHFDNPQVLLDAATLIDIRDATPTPQTRSGLKSISSSPAGAAGITPAGRVRDQGRPGWRDGVQGA